MAAPTPERPEYATMTVLASWSILITAGLLEIVWAIALKHADGFTRPRPSLRGLGTAGVAIAGMILLGEAMSPLRLVSLALVLLGVLGLKIAES
jgi:quaternary ammonium compound-resistance protein SugE